MDESPAQAQWRRWLDDHAPRFLLFARQKTRSEADAQDLVQEAVLEAVQRNGDHGPPPLPLVYATIHRRAIDLARSERRRTGRELAVMESTQGAWFCTSVEEAQAAPLGPSRMQRVPDIQDE